MIGAAEFSLDLPDVEIAGILYETARPPLARARRLRRLARLMGQREFFIYVICRLAAAARGHAVDVFAFPLGKPENASPAALQRALQHYAVVMSAAGGSNIGPLTPPAELRRYFHPDSLWELELQVQGILDRAVPALQPVPIVLEPAPAM